MDLAAAGMNRFLITLERYQLNLTKNDDMDGFQRTYA